MKILPAVAFTDIARTRRAERVCLSFIDGREGEAERTLLRRKHAARSITLDFRRIVATLSPKPWREQHIGSQGRVSDQIDLHQQNVAIGIRSQA